MSTQITHNFNLDEFSCKCGCGLDAIDPVIPRYLQTIRDDINRDVEWISLGRGEFRIGISSGCRCLKHNADEYSKLHPGKPVNSASPHLPQADGICKAVDCQCSDSVTRFFLIKYGLQWFKNMEWGTTNWIHFDRVNRAYGPSIFIP